MDALILPCGAILLILFVALLLLGRALRPSGRVRVGEAAYDAPGENCAQPARTRQQAVLRKTQRARTDTDQPFWPDPPAPPDWNAGS